MTQNGLNLMGVSPYAFQMVVGLVILVAITMSNLEGLEAFLRRFARPRRVQARGKG